jgi:natural product precursor
MKQIKKIVLRDATKLTNSEMKKIRGGYEVGNIESCSAVCYNHTGAVIGNISIECGSEEKCESYYENGVGKVNCINKNYGSVIDSGSCPSIDFPPVEQKL